MEGVELLLRFLALTILFIALPIPILRIDFGGFRAEDYAAAEAALTVRYLLVAPILAGLCLKVLHFHEVVPVIIWILKVQVRKPFGFELTRATRDRYIRGDRRLQARGRRDRDRTLPPTELPRKEDHPICLRTFQLRLDYYPWAPVQITRVITPLCAEMFAPSSPT
jgi:hypothetical protein